MNFRGGDGYVMRSRPIAEVRAYYRYDETRDCELTVSPMESVATFRRRNEANRTGPSPTIAYRTSIRSRSEPSGENSAKETLVCAPGRSVRLPHSASDARVR